MIEAEHIAEIGEMLMKVRLSMQRTYPRVSCEGPQDREDRYIEASLDGTVGTYVDVGASYPLECSNTWRLYQQGWRGLLIEPLPDPWPAILRQRPGDTLWPQAVSNYTGWGTIRVCGTVSSMRTDWEIAERALVACEVDTLANILARFPDIRDRCRLCSIDVEGLEREVLEGVDWATFKPDVFVVEWLRYDVPPPDNDLSPEWQPILEAHGYRKLARTTTNLVFARD